MPRVPVYDSPQVAPTAQPSVQFDAPRVIDSTSKQASDMGAGLLNLGVVGMKIEREAIQEANQVRVSDAVNQATEAKLQLTYDREGGFASLRGRAALERPDGKPLPEEYGEKFSERIAKITQGLGNDEQRRLFGIKAGDLSTQFQGLLVQHLAKESFEWQVGVQQGTTKTNIEQAALMWGDPTVVGQSRDAVKAAVAEEGRLRGYSGQQIVANTTEALSALNASVVQGAVDGNKLDYAREYFKQNQADFTPNARLQVNKLLEAGGFEERTQGFTESVMGAAGGDTAQALKLARERYAGKEEDAVVSRIKSIDAERVALRERGQRDAADSAWQMIAAGRRPPLSLLQAMDGRDRKTLEEKLQADAEGRAIKTNVAKWLEFTDLPAEKMAGMSGQQLLTEYRMHFSDADLRNAQQMAKAAKAAVAKQPGDAEGLQLLTTTELMKRTARELGVLPRSGQPSPAQETQFMDFTGAIQVKVNDWEAANKKKATPEVLGKILNDAKMDKVRVDVWGFDVDKPVTALAPGEMDKAYVVVPDKGRNVEIPLSAVPPGYRIQAISRRRAAGLPVTESAIAQMWVIDGRPSK